MTGLRMHPDRHACLISGRYASGPRVRHREHDRRLASQINRETGVSVLIVEQKVREALAILHRIYGLRLGKVAYSALPDQLSADKDALRRLFL